jgi:hypothetical protein
LRGLEGNPEQFRSLAGGTEFGLWFLIYGHVNQPFLYGKERLFVRLKSYSWQGLAGWVSCRGGAHE